MRAADKRGSAPNARRSASWRSIADAVSGNADMMRPKTKANAERERVQEKPVMGDCRVLRLAGCRNTEQQAAVTIALRQSEGGIDFRVSATAATASLLASKVCGLHQQQRRWNYQTLEIAPPRRQSTHRQLPSRERASLHRRSKEIRDYARGRPRPHDHEMH